LIVKVFQMVREYSEEKMRFQDTAGLNITAHYSSMKNIAMSISPHNLHNLHSGNR